MSITFVSVVPVQEIVFSLKVTLILVLHHLNTLIISWFHYYGTQGWVNVTLHYYPWYSHHQLIRSYGYSFSWISWNSMVGNFGFNLDTDEEIHC